MFCPEQDPVQEPYVKIEGKKWQTPKRECDPRGNKKKKNVQWEILSVSSWRQMLQRERNMELDERRLGRFPLPQPPPLSPVARVLIRYTSFVLHTGLAVGLDPHGYGNPDFCWLSVHDTLIWSFAGPICVVVLVGSQARVKSLPRLQVWSAPAWVKLTRPLLFIRWTLWSSSWPQRLPAVAGRGPWRSQEPCKFFCLIVILYWGGCYRIWIHGHLWHHKGLISRNSFFGSRSVWVKMS